LNRKARSLRLGTRGSALALWQANYVADMLRERNPNRDVEIVVIRTTGDVRQDVPLPQVAGLGVFVREIESALLAGSIDAAVDSAKDLQSTDTRDLKIGAFCRRADPRDALVSPHGGLASLPSGALVGTGAPRRIAQLARVRPDLRFSPLRGNVDTRLGKLARGDCDALMLAAAGLDRLGRADVITERLSLEMCLPQVGQACIAVQCRDEDETTADVLRDSCDHPPTRHAVTVERAFLALLGGGCTAPVAAHATEDAAGFISLIARVGKEDGSELLQAQHRVAAGAAVELAPRILDDLLAQGAAALLTGAR